MSFSCVDIPGAEQGDDTLDLPQVWRELDHDLGRPQAGLDRPARLVVVVGRGVQLQPAQQVLPINKLEQSLQTRDENNNK